MLHLLQFGEGAGRLDVVQDGVADVLLFPPAVAELRLVALPPAGATGKAWTAGVQAAGRPCCRHQERSGSGWRTLAINRHAPPDPSRFG
jgi:hypothetical protein